MPRVIVITGASSGIGRASARQLARRGDHLVLVARGQERLQATAEECRELGAGSVTATPVDVADRRLVENLFTDVVAEQGKVDGVIHSAGVAAYGRFTDVDPEVLDRVLAVNYLGTANVSRAALRHFAERDRGDLVLVGSLLGKIATPYMSPYISSKWAVHGLVRVLQLEYRKSPGISVSLVTPGGVDTPIYRWAASSLGRQGQPPPPVDPPEKVAAAAVDALERPRREVSVGLSNHLTVFGFRVLPGLFDRMVTPLMDLFGVDPQTVEEHQGNVFSPQPDPTQEPYGVHNSAPVRLIRRTVNDIASVLTRTGQGTQTSAVQLPSQPPESSTDSLSALPLVERRLAASPAQVWQVLSDGWLYANWVVGASRTRQVEESWPAPGARIHHSFGIWPAVLDDTTEVVSSRPGELMRLRARGGPLGQAEVIITLVADVAEDGDESTVVGIREDAVAGPGTLLPRALRQVAIVPRNREALRRLAYLAEG